MKKLLMFLALVFLLYVSNFGFAQGPGPYLISDGYPVDASQPEDFVIVLNGTEYISLAVANGEGLLHLRFDLAGLWLAENNLTVKARNPWGESATVPFAFTAGVPGEVGGLRIVSSGPGP